MKVFDYTEYKTSSHAVKRMCERVGDIYPYEAQQKIIELVKTGEILLDVGDHRYIRNGDLFFPCTKWKGIGEHVYRVKSVLKWDMVNYRIQRVVDNYAEKQPAYL